LDGLETAVSSWTTPLGAADEAAPVPSVAELSAAGVAPAVPACDAFDGLVAGLLDAAVMESAAEEPVFCASDEEGSAAGVVAALVCAPPEPVVFRFEEEPVWEDAPVVVVVVADLPAGACVPAAGVEAAGFAGVCVDGGGPWLRLPLAGELVRERKNEPPPCESLARSAGDAFASEEELGGETRAATGMPTLFIVMLAS
jgi:hypothetical protein